MVVIQKKKKKKKKDDSSRRTVDPQKLNAALMRETHHTLSSFYQLSLVPARIRKTILDAWNGYHRLSLFPTGWEATRLIKESGPMSISQSIPGVSCIRRWYHCGYSEEDRLNWRQPPQGQWLAISILANSRVYHLLGQKWNCLPFRHIPFRWKWSRVRRLSRNGRWRKTNNKKCHP